MYRIKSVKSLKRLPSGNFLDTKTRIVYAKGAIKKKFAEELAEIKEPQKAKSKTKAKSKGRK